MWILMTCSEFYFGAEKCYCSAILFYCGTKYVTVARNRFHVVLVHYLMVKRLLKKPLNRQSLIRIKTIYLIFLKWVMHGFYNIRSKKESPIVMQSLYQSNKLINGHLTHDGRDFLLTRYLFLQLLFVSHSNRKSPSLFKMCNYCMIIKWYKLSEQWMIFTDHLFMKQLQ